MTGNVVAFPGLTKQGSRSLRKKCPVCKSPAGERCEAGKRSVDDTGTHHERIAAAVADAWWEDVKLRTGHRPVQSYESLIGQRGIVTRMLRADWDAWDVLRAMASLHGDGRPITLVALEARLNGCEQHARQTRRLLHPQESAMLAVMARQRR